MIRSLTSRIGSQFNRSLRLSNHQSLYSSAPLAKDDSDLLNNLLKRYENGNLKAKEASEVIIELSRGHPQQTLMALKNPSDYPILKEAIDVLESSQVQQLEPRRSIAVLKSLFKVELPEDSLVLDNIANDLIWKSRSCSINQLYHLLTFVVKKRDNSPIFAKLFEVTTQSLEMRWVEITDVQMMLGLFFYGNHFKPGFWAKLEDKLTASAEDMPTELMIQVIPFATFCIVSRNLLHLQTLKTMGMSKRRPSPLIKAISYHLTRRKDLTDIKLLSDALFGAASLSIKDPELLETLCSNVETCLKDLDPNDSSCNAVIRSIVTSLGHLSFYHEACMNLVTNWYASKLEQNVNVDNGDLMAYLLTTANLNITPENSQKIFDVSTLYTFYQINHFQKS